MKDKKHIKTFEQNQENLNISDVRSSNEINKFAEQYFDEFFDGHYSKSNIVKLLVSFNNTMIELKKINYF